jgi:hypothetical protein
MGLRLFNQEWSTQMKKVFGKLVCRMSDHKWVHGLALDNGLDCLRCGAHREWISLNVYDYMPWLKEEE